MMELEFTNYREESYPTGEATMRKDGYVGIAFGHDRSFVVEFDGQQVAKCSQYGWQAAEWNINPYRRDLKNLLGIPWSLIVIGSLTNADRVFTDEEELKNRMQEIFEPYKRCPTVRSARRRKEMKKLQVLIERLDIQIHDLDTERSVLVSQLENLERELAD